jgi:hypothetical protein
MSTAKLYESVKNITKLNEKNWPEWKRNITLALKLRKLWDCVNLSGTESDDNDKKLEAMSIILFAMEDDQQRHLDLDVDDMDPRKAWKKLLEAKEPKSSAMLVIKLTELLSLRQNHTTTTMTDHFTHIKKLRREIDSLVEDEKKYVEMLYAAVAIASISPRYDTFRTLKAHTKPDDLTMEKIEQGAVLEEQTRNLAELSVSGSSAIASANVAAGERPQCTHRNHPPERCFTLYPHLREKFLKENEEKKRKQSAQMAFVAMKQHHATMAKAMHTALPPSQWLIDSAASAHMCNDRAMFTNIRPTDTVVIVLGEGNKILANEAGDIPMRLKLHNSDFDCILTDVLYVPDMKRNLISMLGWKKQHITCETTLNGPCIIKEDNSVIGQVLDNNNLLPVTVVPLRQSVTQTASAAVTGYANKLELWHYRTGHANERVLRSLPSVVEDCDIDNRGSMVKSCEACHVSKAHSTNLSLRHVSGLLRPFVQ